MFVSVIVPVYNAERNIAQCVKSILTQKTEHEFEIIIVDDGSNDKTKDRVNEFDSKNLKYFYQKNSGPAKARNLGANKAKGEIILFTDSDCLAENNWINEMIKPFKEKNITAVQGAYKSHQKELIARFGQLEIEHRYEYMKKSKSLDWVGSYSAAYKKDIFKKMGGFDESFPIASGEDPELSYKIQEAGHKIIFNPNAIVYHTHPNSLFGYLKTKFFRAYYRPKMYSKHKSKMIKDSYTPQSLKLQIICFYTAILGLVLSLINPIAQAILFLAIIIHLILGIKFFMFCLSKDFEAALVSPIILMLRSIVFGAGLLWGRLNG